MKLGVLRLFLSQLSRIQIGAHKVPIRVDYLELLNFFFVLLIFTFVSSVQMWVYFCHDYSEQMQDIVYCRTYRSLESQRSYSRKLILFRPNAKFRLTAVTQLPFRTELPYRFRLRIFEQIFPLSAKAPTFQKTYDLIK